MNLLFKNIRRAYISATMRIYRKFYIPIRSELIRKKKVINIAFTIASLGAWKSESLYLAMLSHPRFNPILIIGRSDEEDNREDIVKYCKKKRYKYFEVEHIGCPLWKQFRPDIIFYQKPYSAFFWSNRKSLLCYTTYGFHSSTADWSFKQDMFYNCWQIYYENQELCEYYSSRMGRGILNGYATGIPPMDELSIPKEKLNDPWKFNQSRKRIIYAPHHSINPNKWWESSTFLSTGEIILQLAEKYQDKVQWAFKPHPLLRKKLETVWGKEKTDEYYSRWTNSEWSQYESGEYLGLFKHSDAMIHDCGSFIMEYHATGNPVMYLTPDGKGQENWNRIAQKAFGLHTIGYSLTDIESFIQNVINGVDNGKNQRGVYFNTYFTAPFSRSASENILDCILSEESAKNFKYPK